MAQHRASTRAILRSSLKHKKAADKFYDALNALTDNIAAAKAKVLADTNTSWDTDYVATAAVTAVDFDAANIGQNKAALRFILIKEMAHKKLGNDLCDMVEEAQVTLNLVLAQMDADAGTLSNDVTYEAFRISDVMDVDAKSFGQHKQSFRKVMQVALSHKAVGSAIAEQVAAIQTEINAIIDAIQAAN